MIILCMINSKQNCKVEIHIQNTSLSNTYYVISKNESIRPIVIKIKGK